MSNRQFEAITQHESDITLAHQNKAPEAAVESYQLPGMALNASGDPRSQAYADALPQTSGGSLTHPGASLLQLQRGYGNRYVQAVVKRGAPVIQTKLVLGPADDRYEREADRVAKQVTSGAAHPALDVGSRPPAIQRMSSAEGGAVDAGVQQTIQQARGGGQPLPESVRGSMEQALGADFGGVRLHTDAQADQLNRALQARAFTAGQDLFFRRGEYTPGSTGGRKLLAHELTHVVQQRKGAAKGVGSRGGVKGGKDSTRTNNSERSGAGEYVQRVILGKDGGVMSEDQAVATIPALVAKWLQSEDVDVEIKQKYEDMKASFNLEAYNRLMIDAIKELVKRQGRTYNLQHEDGESRTFGPLAVAMQLKKIKMENERGILENGLPFGTNNHVLVQNAGARFTAGIARGRLLGEEYYGAHPVYFTAEVSASGESTELEKWEIGFTQTMISSTMQLEIENAKNWTFIVEESTYDSYNDSLSEEMQPWMAQPKACSPYGGSVTVVADDAPRITIPSSEGKIKKLHVKGLDKYRTWLILRNKTSRDVVYLAEWSWQVHYGDGIRAEKQAGAGATQEGAMKQATKEDALPGAGVVLTGEIANEVTKPGHQKMFVYLPGADKPSMQGSVQHLHDWL